MKIKISFFILLFFINHSSISYATDNWQLERWYFKKSYKALSEKDLNTFEYLLTQLELKSYPIAHYLHYFYLRQYLETESLENFQFFFKQHQDSAAASPLQRAWLRKLAQQKDWETFIAVYTPQKNVVLQCFYLKAYLQLKDELNDKLIKIAKKLWLVGKSQSSVCDSTFSYLYKNDLISNSERWQRIRLAMKNNKVKLARFLSRELAETDKKLFEQWQSLHHDPAYALKKFKHPDTELAREIALYGIKRLAKKDVEKSYSFLQIYKKNYRFNQKQYQTSLRYIALRAFSNNNSNALTWLEEISAYWSNESVNQARLKLVLLAENWNGVIQLAQELYQTDKKNEEQWQYWQARALEQLGRTNEAEEKFLKLAKIRNYYGFLAAYDIGSSYSFQKTSVGITKIQKQQLLKKHPKLIIARELFLTGWAAFARSEWNEVISKFSAKEIKIAASLAHDWQWHDRSISALHKVKFYDDLDLRFPMPFYTMVQGEAKKKHLNFAYIYAIIRQESIFQTDAHSSAGALGLMQLMPATAKEVARKHKIKLQNTYTILEPKVNIQLGTAYLRQMLDRFDNNHLLATAAYNAGPSRSKRWREQYGCFPADIWIELIPFSQTRNYVKSVLSYTLVFDFQIMGKKNINPILLDTIYTETDKCSMQ